MTNDAPQAPTTVGQPKKRTVLLADDDEDIRALLASALRREGYRVIEASDGAEILDHIGDALLFDDAERPDIIVSDQRMPGFVGTGILSGIRASEWSTPFVLITAYGTDQFEREAMELGADAVVRKPFDVDHVLSVIGGLLLVSRPRTRRPSA